MKSKITLILALVAALALVGVAQPAHAANTLYTSRAAFDAAAGSLPTEDFENGPAESIDACPNPMSADITPFTCLFGGTWAAGSLLDGVEWGATEDTFSSPTDGVVYAGAGFFGNSSKVLAANYFVESFKVDLGAGVDSIGFDVIAFPFFGTSSCDVTFYDASGVVATTSSACDAAGSSFVGITSSTPITKVIIDSPIDNPEGVDNVSFGSATALVAHPAILDLAGPGPTLTLSATLTTKSSGTPLAGQTVDFTAGSFSCSATTDAAGLASCGGPIPPDGPVNAVLNGGTYDASFAGSAPYGSSSASGGLIG